MSRTLKDKPFKTKHEPWDIDWVWLEGYKHRNAKTKKTKKRKEVDTEDHWMSTPGWWIRLVMNRPERRKHHLLEKKILRENDLEDVDFVDTGRKPHIYFY